VILLQSARNAKQRLKILTQKRSNNFGFVEFLPTKAQHRQFLTYKIRNWANEQYDEEI
jgi:hypothetical protein